MKFQFLSAAWFLLGALKKGDFFRWHVRNPVNLPLKLVRTKREAKGFTASLSLKIRATLAAQGPGRRMTGMAAAFWSCWVVARLKHPVTIDRSLLPKNPGKRQTHPLEWSFFILYGLLVPQAGNPKTTVHDQSATKIGQDPLYRA